MARKKQKRMWVYSPAKAPKPKVPESEKQLITQKCNELIETELKPKHIKPPPTDNEWNYLVDIFGKWYRNYFYFCSTYNCPSPNAIVPSFEDKFARLEYVGKDSFNIAYMRHTGKWWEIFQGLTLEQCLEEMKNNVILHPH
jgi:hypothetical protein